MQEKGEVGGEWRGGAPRHSGASHLASRARVDRRGRARGGTREGCAAASPGWRVDEPDDALEDA